MHLRLASMLALAPAISLGAVGCSSPRSSFDTPVDAEAPPVPSLGDAAVESSTPVSGECTNENKQVYVISTGEKTLYRFEPESLKFTRIGDLHCPTAADTFSMAVDRHGTAWVEYADGQIFHVSTIDASCVETKFTPHQAGFTNFGMGFAKDDSPAGETLYIAGEALGKIDTNTLQVGLIGNSVGLAELTGTGGGLLFAFVASNGRVAKIDKATGAVISNYRTTAINPNASWAFAQWGGDFWLFTSATVTRYSPATDTSTVVVKDAGFSIVGAGVSTCAPFEPPH